MMMLSNLLDKLPLSVPRRSCAGLNRTVRALKAGFVASFFVGTGLLLSSCNAHDAVYTRGLGVYPGDRTEDFSPELYVDQSTYRNLAFRRPAYQSSSYDYNLTAQLVTDGVKDTRLPHWFSASTSQHGTLKKHEREWLIDHNDVTTVDLEGSGVWVDLGMAGGDEAPDVDRIDVSARIRTHEQGARGWAFKVLGSDDGLSWEEAGVVGGNGYPGELLPQFPWMRGPSRFRMVRASIPFETPVRRRFYRVEVNAPIAASWSIGDVSLYRGDDPVEIAPSHTFTSTWMSAGREEEWVYVDLGAVCTFDQVRLHWIRRAAAGVVQVSDDATQWRDIQPLSASNVLTDALTFESPVSGRYVRVLMTQPASPEDYYVLSEMEVIGRGGPVPRSRPRAQTVHDNRLDLAGGAWTVQRASFVDAEGETLSERGYEDDDWVPATVPGTVLVSYLNAGALPDPNYGDNQLLISESFFNADFWYRNEFTPPPTGDGRHTFLNFDGINWKATVYLNGHRVGRIEGAFTRGLFDVSDLMIPDRPNALAVLLEKNANPGNIKEQTFESPDRNGGVLGADNPTFHASIGWDWIPTIRGRNTGIWNDVYLTVSGPVTIENPFVTTDLPLPDTTTVDVRIEVSLQNHEATPVAGTLRGTFGEAAFEQPVTLQPSERKTVTVEPATHPALRIQNPALWWPNGYGAPHLYTVDLAFETEDQGVSDATSFQTGVRELAYEDESGALKIYINGRRFVGRGGNWGFSESMLRYRAREYDDAVRYHKDMNFTMIRNWVGQTGDEEFYEACDRHGVMVWQDFWLANPVDGPNPDDNEMFMDNVEDYVRRIRNHPSIALYCGRNEGNPPEALDTAIRETLPQLHPGLHYISHSSIGTVSGFGPYGRMPVKFYFENRATPKLHSELGMPNIVTQESLNAMMPDSAQWPIGRMWGLHDFCELGAMRSGAYLEMFDQHFGAVDTVEDWISLAQFMNYDGYRAMFEAQGKNRMGLVIWMSHPAWPSFVWQTYDYYFEPTAAYFGSKKASEPLHIQWNASTDSIEVVNYSAGDVSGLAATVELLNLDGSVQWQRTDSLDSAEDSMVRVFKMDYPESLTDVHFIRLKLDRGQETLSENFYWRGSEEGNYRAIRDLPTVRLEAATQIKHQGAQWFLTTTLNNTSEAPALLVRLKVVRDRSGDRILPVLYSDNYVSLMPGERRVIRMELQHADTRGERPRVRVSGFNIE